MMSDILLFEIEQRRKHFLDIVNHSKFVNGEKHIIVSMNWFFKCPKCKIKDNYKVFKIRQRHKKKFVSMVSFYCPNCKKNKSALCSIPESMFILPKIRGMTHDA